jgi:hypothetical protein
LSEPDNPALGQDFTRADGLASGNLDSYELESHWLVRDGTPFSQTTKIVRLRRTGKLARSEQNRAVLFFQDIAAFPLRRKTASVAQIHDRAI